MTTWKDIARELPLYGKVQIACPTGCGSGEKLSVNHSPKSYWANCYRCGWTDQEDKGKQTLEELKKLRELNEAAETMELTLDLPEDFTNELPLHARLWLFKAGITEARYRSFNIGYSKSLDRVILPIFDTSGDLIWYQCRALQKGQKPKYLQPKRDRSTVMFSVLGGRGDMESAIVVEDILSAIRVGKHQDTYSLLGTKITTDQANQLSRYGTVTTWFDPDTAGIQGASKIRRTLNLLTNTNNITSDKDPKELSDKEIRSKICGVNLNQN